MTLPFPSLPSAPEPTTPPAWLDALRPDDGLAAAAYDTTPGPRRALLKCAVAFQFHLWGEAPAEETRRELSPATGFARTSVERPVSWVLAVLDPAHAAPARLLAALLPAVLAGAGMVLIVCPDRPPTPAQLVALELAGLENLYVLPHGGPSPVTLLEELAACGQGRLLLFPTEQKRLAQPFQALREGARRLRVRMWQDRPAPRIALLADRDDAAALREQVLWAHGDAVIETFTPVDRPDWRGFDACCAAPEYLTDVPFPDGPLLLLGPGSEACWLHERLDRHFFRTAACAVRLCR